AKVPLVKGSAHWYVLAAWDQEPKAHAITNEKDFLRLVEGQSNRIAQPAFVRVISPEGELTKVAADFERADQKLKDWPQLSRYSEANRKVQPVAAKEQRVVFMGDSITDGWGKRYGKFFPESKSYINRGISGQTTSQMLIRFRP